MADRLEALVTTDTSRAKVVRSSSVGGDMGETNIAPAGKRPRQASDEDEENDDDHGIDGLFELKRQAGGSTKKNPQSN